MPILTDSNLTDSNNAPRQTWETPRLIDLNTQQTQSGKPNSVESTGFEGTVQYFFGPTGTTPS